MLYMNEKHDPTIWGPHYWFVMHSIAMTYPSHPNPVSKRKYYDFFMNLPLFLPDVDMGAKFSELLDSFPITPYLDCRDSLVRWVYFIHNKINRKLAKDEITLGESIDLHYSKYKPKPIYLEEIVHMKTKWIHAVFIGICIFLIYWYK